jgi:hypothetical protein
VIATIGTSFAALLVYLSARVYRATRGMGSK